MADLDRMGDVIRSAKGLAKLVSRRDRTPTGGDRRGCRIRGSEVTQTEKGASEAARL
jgi:hypothetical protein